LKIEFNDPQNCLNRFRENEDYQKAYATLVHCIFNKPEYLAQIISFFDSWRKRYTGSTKRIIRTLRTRIKHKRKDDDTSRLCKALDQIRNYTPASAEEYNNIFAAFIEYLIFCKMEQNYPQDDTHEIYGYDLRVVVNDHEVEGNRIDVAVILRCKPELEVQMYECKCLPHDVDDIRENIQFLEKVKTEVAHLWKNGKLDVYLLCMHDEEYMKLFKITEDFYPTVNLFGIKRVKERILRAPAACSCKHG
jgi:hypothetical protein